MATAFRFHGNVTSSRIAPTVPTKLCAVSKLIILYGARTGQFETFFFRLQLKSPTCATKTNSNVLTLDVSKKSISVMVMMTVETGQMRKTAHK